MFKKMTKVLSLVLVLAMMLSSLAVLSSCDWFKKPDETEGKGEYTYRSYTTAFGTNWNPHTWENSADDSMLSYVSSPFVTMEAKDTAKGTYQWVYEMATSIKDVTATHQSDLTKYKVNLGGKSASEVTSGYVYEIKLNPDAKWQTGEAITADDYIYSMERLLNSHLRNYRANLYYSGESAVAGGNAYYNSEVPLTAPVIGYTDPEDSSTRHEVVDLNTTPLYINLTSESMTIASYSFNFMLNYNVDKDIYADLNKQADAYGNILVTKDNLEDIITIADQYLWAFGAKLVSYEEAENGAYVYDEESESYVLADEGVTGTHNRVVDTKNLEEFYLYYTGEYGDKVEYDTVGCYKVDNYTIIYVCENAIDYNYFLTSCTSTWLVHEATYENCLDKTGTLWTSTYNTSPETTVSYGLYKFKSYQTDKQVVFVPNENWYGWEKDENGNNVRDDEGNLVSYTSYHKNTDGEVYKVDGEILRQYTITKVVIDKMEEAAAKQAFLKGQLSDWSPSATDLPTYAASDRLYKADESYTMSLFFNTDVDALKNMDKEGNVNSVVLSNTNFRKAFSLAINRSEYVTATEGYKPAFALFNNLYYYDYYNNPDSMYRNTEYAKKAIVNLYGVEYGEGTPYATLDEAVNSVNGYNLTEAKALMKTACDELVKAGLYTKGQDITIKIAWSASALDSSANQQLTLMNKYINAAVEGSGFGKVTLEGIGNLENRYTDVRDGLYAIGYGAWGGAVLYPFRGLQVYLDPSLYDVNELACWDPTTEELTLTVNGEKVTMTWQAWGNSMTGKGQFANADNEIKLYILSQLEEKYLEFYYRIPLCGTTSSFLLSYQLSYYTDEYNLAYGFGGSRIMTFNYDDAEWTELVKSKGGTLSYE